MADRATEEREIALRPDGTTILKYLLTRGGKLSNKGMASFMLTFLNLCRKEGHLGGRVPFDKLAQRADF